MIITKLGGLDAVIHEPTAAGKYPTLIFYVGRGEFGPSEGNVDDLYVAGPGKFLKAGFSPQNLVIACVQNVYYQSKASGIAVTNKVLDDIIARGKTDKDNIFATGLSAGCANWLHFVLDSLANTKRVKGYVFVAGQVPNEGLPGGSNPRFPSEPIYFNQLNSPYWHICGTSDSFYAKQKAFTAMIDGAIWTDRSGGHNSSVWDYVYNPASRIAPVNTNIYDWIVAESNFVAPTTTTTTSTSTSTSTSTTTTTSTTSENKIIAQFVHTVYKDGTFTTNKI